MGIVENIKSEVNIIDALQKYTTADTSKMRGKKKANICCPFHSEKSPSFLVDTTKDTWHCFGACGVGGDVISLYAVANGISNKEAITSMGTELNLIDSEHKISPKVKREINKLKLDKQIKIIETLEADKTYDGLCSIYRIITELIQDADTIEELELISIVVDEVPYINYLLDILLLHKEDEDYKSAYISAKEVIEKWEQILV